MFEKKNITHHHSSSIYFKTTAFANISFTITLFTITRYIAQCLIIAVTLASLSSCGKNESTSKNPRVEFSEKTPIVGPLSQHIEELQKAKIKSACDIKNLTMMREITTELDKKSAEIKSYRDTLPKLEDYNRVKVGPLIVKEMKPEVEAKLNPKKEWKNFNYGWGKIIEFYNDTLKNPNTENWEYLDSRVRGILLDDKDRLRGVSYFISHDHGPMLKSIIESSEKCLERRIHEIDIEKKCSVPEFKFEEISWLKIQPDYSVILADLEDKEINIEKKDEALKKLIRYLKIDNQTFEFIKNDSITRKNNILILPIVSGPFSEITKELSHYIESVWSSTELSLIIDWKKDLSLSFFSMFFDGDGGRAFVRPKKKEIHITNDVYSKTIAHEIGHVIGFSDRYFTTWNDKECIYSSEYIETDLMSDSSMGSVTDDDWKTLKRVYNE